MTHGCLILPLKTCAYSRTRTEEQKPITNSSSEQEHVHIVEDKYL